MMTPREEKELLLRVVTPLIEKQLTKAGFMPFGAVLGCKRDVQLLMPKSMKQGVQMHELDAYWKEQLRRAIDAGECRAVCYCVDLRVPVGDDGPLTPAVFIHVEHIDGSAEDVLYKYETLEGSKIAMGAPYVETATQRIFSS